MDAAAILELYARRWTLEVTFHDTKQCLGFEDAQTQSRQAVEKTAPLACLVYGLVLVRPLLWVLLIPRARLMPVVFVLCTVGAFAITSRPSPASAASTSATPRAGSPRPDPELTSIARTGPLRRARRIGFPR